MKQFYCTVALSISLVIMGCAKHDENNDLNSVDYEFLQQTSKYNTGEIAAAELAISKSTNAVVKGFARDISSSYADAQSELEAQANYLKVALTNSLNIGSRAVSNSLNSFSGYQFDTAYLWSRVRAHKDMLSVYQRTFN